MIAFGDVEDDGLSLNFSIGTRRCVELIMIQMDGGEDGKEGSKLTNLIRNGFQGSFVPSNHQHVESFFCKLNRVFSSNSIRSAGDDCPERLVSTTWQEGTRSLLAQAPFPAPNLLS